jgi:hypothetical protein
MFGENAIFKVSSSDTAFLEIKIWGPLLWENRSDKKLTYTSITGFII